MSDFGLGDFFASEAQKDANNANRENSLRTSDLNYDMNRRARGFYGNAVLPEYGERTEIDAYYAAVNAGKAINNSYGDSYAQLRRNKELMGQYDDLSSGANTTANGIFNGELSREQLGDFAPLAEARNQGVGVRKQSGLEALAQTINETKSIQARKGFSGDSLSNRMVEANQRRQIYGQSATDQANVNERNASDIYGIKKSDMDRRIGNLNLPYAMSKQSMDMNYLPGNSMLDQQARSQNLMGFFKLGQNQFKYDPLPTVQPNANLGMIGAGVAGGINNLAAQWYMGNGGSWTPQNNTPAPAYSNPAGSALSGDATGWYT